MNTLEVVPWICKQEWEYCRDNLFGNDISLKQKALQHLYIWKIRSPNLPVSIECTMILMEVYLKDTEENTTVSELKVTTMSFESWYSMAIMRFLNLITDSSVGSKSVSSMNELAQLFNIPQWIVEIRHTAAHGHSLPNLTKLREAAEFCLHWLHENYWYKDSYRDFGETESNEGSASFTILCYDICRLLKQYLSRGFTNLSGVELSDREIICKIITKKIRKKPQDEVDSFNLDEIYTVATKRLTRHLMNDVQNAHVLVDYILKTEERLIQPDAFQNNKLHPQTENECMDFLSLLCDSSGCSYFLKQLSNIIIDQMEVSWRKKCAAQFFNYILKSIMICKQKNCSENTRKKTLKRKYHEREEESESKSFIKITSIHVSKNELMDILLLLLEKPNEFADIFLKNLLSVLDITPGTERFQEILKLVNIYNGKFTSNIDSEERTDSIFSLRDVLGGAYQSHGRGCEMQTEVENNQESDQFIWMKTPLGRLPWQTNFQPWLLIYESEEKCS